MLRTLFDYPTNSNDLLPAIITAYTQEVAEVLGEIKSYWAWWTKKPLSREKLLEELADVMFFHQIYVLHAQEYSYGFDLAKFTVHFESDLRLAEMYYQPDVRRIDQGCVVRELGELQRIAHGAESKPHETLLRLGGVYWRVLHRLGFTAADLERAYLGKFLVNLERTGKRGSVLGSRLAEQVQQCLDDLDLPQLTQRMVS